MSEQSPSHFSPESFIPTASQLAEFRRAHDVRAVVEIAITALPFTILWALMAWLSFTSLWLSALLTIPTAAFLVRLFMIQHDCGHGSMFSSRKVNDWVGRILGILTLTPFDFWRRSHALHHAGSGHLGRRGIGDIDTLTLDEYRALSWRRRLGYRAYRHPIVLFLIGPAYLFLLQHRLPIGAMSKGMMPWASTMTTNFGILIVGGLLVWALGLGTFLTVHVPIVLIAASAGVWLFYVQHQFERTYWEGDSRWNHATAALHGSSFYDLPRPLMWITGNIGIHHLHHLNSRIPYYRLPEVLAAFPQRKTIGQLTCIERIVCCRRVMWANEEIGK